MTVYDALKSVLIFQLLAGIINIVLIDSSNFFTRAIRCIIGHLIGVVLYSLILYCFGATIFNRKWNPTQFSLDQLSYDLYILSMLLSSLTVVPLFIKCSFDLEDIRKIIMNVKRKPSYFNDTSFSYPFWATIIGTIFGCYILALDWFRPYQEFPLPCLMGACFGHLIGVVSILLFPMFYRFPQTKND